MVNGKEIDSTSAGYFVKNLAEKAGIKKRVHPHLFRHSRLTELAKILS